MCGGGIYNFGGSPTIMDCFFVDNISDSNGGAIGNFDFDNDNNGYNDTTGTYNEEVWVDAINEALKKLSYISSN